MLLLSFALARFNACLSHLERFWCSSSDSRRPLIVSRCLFLSGSVQLLLWWSVSLSISVPSSHLPPVCSSSSAAAVYIPAAPATTCGFSCPCAARQLIRITARPPAYSQIHSNSISKLKLADWSDAAGRAGADCQLPFSGQRQIQMAKAGEEFQSDEIDITESEVCRPNYPERIQRDGWMNGVPAFRGLVFYHKKKKMPARKEVRSFLSL